MIPHKYCPMEIVDRAIENEQRQTQTYTVHVLISTSILHLKIKGK